MGLFSKVVSAAKNIFSNGGSTAAAAATGNPYLAAASAGAQLIGGIASANKSASAAKRNTATQISWEREQAQNRIQWAVQDAIKAGINPAVAVGQAPGVSGITPNMPDTSGYQQAGNAPTTAIQLMQRQEEVDAKSQLDRANARKADVESGLKPKEIAIQEANADTARFDAETRRQETLAQINRMMMLLPGETEQQKQEIMEKALQLAVQVEQQPGQISEAKANSKILEITGGIISLKDAKMAVSALIGAGGYHYEQSQNRNSSERIARENRENTYKMHRENYTQRGIIDSYKYDRTKYRQYYSDGYKEYWR